MLYIERELKLASHLNHMESLHKKASYELTIDSQPLSHHPVQPVNSESLQL